MISVLIAEDHQMVRSGIRSFLSTQTDIEIVGEATNGLEAVALTKTLLPDVVLLDILMPEMDGIEACRQIRRESPRTQVVILSSSRDDNHVLAAFQSGALSFIQKSIGPIAMADAIRNTARGEAILDPWVASRVVAELAKPRGESNANPFADLSDRELDVLRLIGNGRSNAQIAETLFISEKTVKGHVSNILGKLYLADRTQAAVFAWQQGLMKK